MSNTDPVLNRLEEWTLRGKWGNYPAIGPLPKLAYVVHHSVTNTAGDTTIESVQEVEDVIYRRRVKDRFSMVAYNDLYPQTGEIYIGRGADHQNGANGNTRGPDGPFPHLTNRNTLSGCLVGNYHPPAGGTLAVTDEQIDAVACRIVAYRAFGVLSSDSLVVSHDDLHATACCGDNGRAVLEAIRLRVIARTTSDPELTPEQVVALMKAAEPPRPLLLTIGHPLP